MEKKKELIVNVKRLSISFIELMLNRQKQEESKKIFQKFTNYHISNLIRLQDPNINDDFPEDLPFDLNWPGTRLQTKEKPKKKINYLEKEAEEFIQESVERKRRSRFSGTYNVDELTENQLKNLKREPQEKPRRLKFSESSFKSDSFQSSTVVEVHLEHPIKSSPLNCANSGDFDSHENRPIISPPCIIQERKKRKKDLPVGKQTEAEKSQQIAITNQVSNDEPIKKKEASGLSNSHTNQQLLKDVKPAKDLISVDTHKQEAKTSAKNSKPKTEISKSLKDHGKETALSKNYKLPPLIEPPNLNPKTLKPMKNVRGPLKKKFKTSNSNGLEALGGIFSIKNGWEKTAEEKRDLIKNITIPKLNKQSDQERQFLSSSLAENEDFTMSSNDKKKPHRYHNIIFVPEDTLISSPLTNKFNFREQDSENSDDDLESVVIHKTKNIFSDSEDEGFEVSADSEKSVDENLRIDVESQQEEIKTLETDDVGDGNNAPMTTTSLEDDSDDLLDLIYNDDLDLFDDNNETQPQGNVTHSKTSGKKCRKDSILSPESSEIYTTDLDELKITFRKEVEVCPPAAAKEEFDRNTNLINTKISTDTLVNRVFRRFFMDACSEYMLSKCEDSHCKRIHIFPEVKAVRIVFERANLADIEEAYGVSINYPKLFETFFPLFAEMLIKKVTDVEPKLGRMIMDCERTPRLSQLFKVLADALVAYKSMSRCEAIKLIIKHSTNSIYGQEEILKMIAETGPDLVQFIDYLENLFQSRSIPVTVLNEIISICVKYQEPKLPQFVLNNLITKNPNELKELNADLKIGKFLQLQHDYLAIDDNARSEKLLYLANRVKSLKR